MKDTKELKIGVKVQLRDYDTIGKIIAIDNCGRNGNIYTILVLGFPVKREGFYTRELGLTKWEIKSVC